MEDKKKIIDFKPREETPQFSAKVQKESRCTHLGIEADETSRKVFCRECGKEIDPFSWILALAKEEVRAESRWYYLTMQAKKIEDRYAQNRRKRVEKLTPKKKD